MRIQDKESDLATNLLLLVFAFALLGFAGNAIQHASTHNVTIATTISAKR